MQPMPVLEARVRCSLPALLPQRAATAAESAAPLISPALGHAAVMRLRLRLLKLARARLQKLLLVRAQSRVRALRLLGLPQAWTPASSRQRCLNTEQSKRRDRSRSSPSILRVAAACAAAHCGDPRSAACFGGRAVPRWREAVAVPGQSDRHGRLIVGSQARFRAGPGCCTGGGMKDAPCCKLQVQGCEGGREPLPCRHMPAVLQLADGWRCVNVKLCKPRTCPW